MITRIVFMKSGVVAEISICDEIFAAEWCKIRGFDTWMPVPVDHGSDPETIRLLEPGDVLTLKAGAKAPAPGKQLAKTSIDKVTKAPKAEVGQVEAG